MPNITLIPRQQLPKLEPVFHEIETALGFLPNSFLLMAYNPRLLKDFFALYHAVMHSNGAIDTRFKYLMAVEVSVINNCHYDQALSACLCEQNGIALNKIDQISQLNFDEICNPAERAALGFIRKAAENPHEVSDGDFAVLRQFFTNEQLIELVSVLALYSWLNCWNTILATQTDENILAWLNGHDIFSKNSFYRAGRKLLLRNWNGGMPFVKPLPRTEKSELEPIFAANETALGFLPNSMLILAHHPAILKAFFVLARLIMKPGGAVKTELKQLAALVLTHQTGCLYCQSHTLYIASREGASNDKLQAIFEFEGYSGFTEPDRAVFSLARDSSQFPSKELETHFIELRKHFSEDQIIELSAVLGLFSWLSIWNITIANQVEECISTWMEKSGIGRRMQLDESARANGNE